MTDDTPHFDEQGRLIAPKYGDVYFSAEDGLAETQHVFLEGNNLATRFAELRPGEVFTIGETGFGTGLNFLAAWQLFEQHADQDARLEFVSVEGLPLEAQTMRRALSPWPELSRFVEGLIEQWGPLWAGVHRFRFAGGRVRLTLRVGEADEAMSKIDAQVDAWFLDGFAPSRNPGMWSEAVFEQVARLSRNEATLATYTAAGHVRRGLQAVGFEIEKRPGFGTKRDMTVGQYRRACADKKWGRHSGLPSGAARTAVVIGGSLAGAFAARSLAEHGIRVTVIEKQRLRDGELPALAPRVAVLQPKLNDIDDANGGWLREGYALIERWLASDTSLAARARWQACGTFQAAHDARAERRLRRFVEQFGDAGLGRWVQPSETKAELGVGLSVGGVVIERAGVLSPAGLCAGLLDHPGITLRDQTQAVSLQRDGRDGRTWRVEQEGVGTITSDRVIVANALDAARFDQTSRLELRPVRGQVTLIEAGGSAGQAGRLTGLRRALFYGGYVLPAVEGVQALGASFVPGDMDIGWRHAEHLDCCDKLAKVLPVEAAQLREIDAPSGWVGLRTTTPRHRCYAQQIEQGLYVSLGHGSHGIASAAAAGEHLASLITGGVHARNAR